MAQTCTIVPAAIVSTLVARDPTQAGKGLTVRIEYRCNCPAGYALLPESFDNFTSCVQCQDGFYRRDDMLLCEPCQPGTYADDSRTSCLAWYAQVSMS